MSRCRGYRRTGGFTLVDILLTISIMAILAGVASTYVTDATNDAKVATVSRNLRAIATAATHFHGLNERWPTATHQYNAPGEFQGLLNREAFLRQTAIGLDENSRYGWYAWRDRYAAAYATYVDPEHAHQIDELIDDGNPQTGYIRVYQWETAVGPVATLAYWLEGAI